jgi:hypothetical protein
MAPIEFFCNKASDLVNIMFAYSPAKEYARVIAA